MKMLARRLLLVLILSLTACVLNTNNVVFDREEVEEMPREMALDTLMSYSKSSTGEFHDGKCVFAEEGVTNKGGGATIPYTNTCFRAQNVSYGIGVDVHPHLFVFDNNGATICDTLLVLQGMGQEDLDNMLKWLGTAMLSLGAGYCPK